MLSSNTPSCPIRRCAKPIFDPLQWGERGCTRVVHVPPLQRVGQLGVFACAHRLLAQCPATDRASGPSHLSGVLPELPTVPRARKVAPHHGSAAGWLRTEATSEQGNAITSVLHPSVCTAPSG